MICLQFPADPRGYLLSSRIYLLQMIILEGDERGAKRTDDGRNVAIVTCLTMRRDPHCSIFLLFIQYIYLFMLALSKS